MGSLKARDSALDTKLDSVVSRLMEHRKVLAHLTTLRSSMERASQSVDDLSTQYGGTEPSMLVQPVPDSSDLGTEREVTLQPPSPSPATNGSPAPGLNGQPTDAPVTEAPTGESAAS